MDFQNLTLKRSEECTNAEDTLNLGDLNVFFVLVTLSGFDRIKNS
jgi:hypothetical protein